MNVTSFLANINFTNLISEANTTTTSGKNLIDRYHSFLLENECSYSLINSFLKEANEYRYDTGVNNVLETLCDIINDNKIYWKLASTCESINNNTSSFNYLNRNAAKQVINLLEDKTEEEVIKYIKAGALKNIMFCEAFRSIIKDIYNDRQNIITDEYTAIHPISYIEESNDALYFEVLGRLYKIDNDTIKEASVNEVSQEFIECSRILEHQDTVVEDGKITFNIRNAQYIIEEEKCNDKTCKTCTRKNKKKEGIQEQKFYNVDDLREHNKLVVSSVIHTKRNEVEMTLESIAKCFERFENFTILDNTRIIHTNNDRFLVIENKTNMFAMSLASNHTNAWKVNTNVVEALDFIKKTTNVDIKKDYKTNIEEVYENCCKRDKARIQESIENDAIESRKRKVEQLTVTYKDSPEKLAVLAKIAEELSIM